MESSPTLDLEAAAMRASVRQRLFGAEEPPATIGRFRVIERLGQGGMGVVWLAHDPDLDRLVALKVVRPAVANEGVTTARARITAEARAIARLAHPNVVAVFDVGWTGGGVYLAMERIEGPTLAVWLQQSRRPWREVIDVFVQAGRGLAAAHAAAIVHRDFKPDNVIVGRDEVGGGVRARVVDFGLALAEPLTTGSEDDVVGDPRITRGGIVLGTPAYMAPEQHRGQTSPATDQFSFCLALAEALLGERVDPKEAARHVARHARVRLMPQRVVRAVVRGLAESPGDRWPSMPALVRELERALSRRTATTIWIGAAVLVATVAGTVRSDPRPAACVDAAGRAEDAWNDRRRSALQDALVAAGPWGDRVAARLLVQLDDRTVAWTAAMQDTCEATWVARTQPEPVDLWRRLCLERGLLQLDSLVGAAIDGRGDALVQLATAIEDLEPVDSCDAAHAERSAMTWSEGDTAAASRIRGTLAEAAALRRASRFVDAKAMADEAARSAGALDHAALEAEALLERGLAEVGAAEATNAQTTLTAAIGRAEAAHHDEVVARAWVALASCVGIDLGRLDEATRMIPVVEGAVARLGGAARVESDLLRLRGDLAEHRGELAAAVVAHQAALDRVIADRGADHPDVARFLVPLSRATRATGDAATALMHAQRGLAIVEDALGPEHPEAASMHTLIGSALLHVGREREAEAAYNRALVILEATLGDRHPRVAAAHHNIANAAMSRQDYAPARVSFRRAVDIDLAVMGADNPNRGASLYALAMASRHLGDPDDASLHLDEAERVTVGAWGADHPDVAYIAVGKGEVAAARGDWRGAIAEFTRAREVLEASLGPAHPRLVHGMVGAALAHLEIGEADRALPLLERAMALGEASQIDPLELAEVRITLAKALVALGRQRARARELAEQGRAVLDDGGAAHRDERDEVDAWLAALPITAEG